MLDALINLVTSTQEYRAGALSVTTLGFAMSVFLTLWWQIPALQHQLATMRASPSVEGVSGVMLTFTLTYDVVFLLYAWEIKMAGGLFNAVVLGPYYGLVLVEYWRRADTPLWETLLGAACIGLVSYTLVSATAGLSYKIISLLCLVGVGSQPLTMLWNQTSEGVNPLFVKWFAGVCVVWCVYSAAIGEMFMAWYGFALAVGFGATWALSYRFAPRTA